jgi:hypothetical protein
MSKPDKKESVDIITESVQMASKIKNAANAAALQTVTALLKEDLEKIKLNENDEFNSQPDYPGDYDQDGGQKRVAGPGDSLEDEGKGPAIIEDENPEDGNIKLEGEDEEDEKKDKKKEEAVTEGDMNTDDDEKDLDLDLKKEDVNENEFSEADEEDDKKKKEEAVTEGELKTENAKLRKQIASLKTENAKVNKALKFVYSKLQETALINQRIAFSNDIFTKYPQLTTESKRNILDSFDRAKTADQIKTVYETTVNVIKTKVGNKKKSPMVTEAQKIAEAAQKNKTKVNDNNLNETYNHFANLAGLNDQ